MTSQPETWTVCELAPAELERQERANAPTLRDLRKAAQELALAGAFTDQTITQQTKQQMEAGFVDGQFVKPVGHSSK